MSSHPVASNSDLIELVKSHIGAYQDFPKEGILFR